MMCEFHESTCNGFGDIWWTDNPIYFSSIDINLRRSRDCMLLCTCQLLASFGQLLCCAHERIINI